jgi:hypothetical protein
MEPQQHKTRTELRETLEFHGPQLAETPACSAASVQSLSALARTQPSLVASVLADWINSRRAAPR